MYDELIRKGRRFLAASHWLDRAQKCLAAGDTIALQRYLLCVDRQMQAWAEYRALN